MMTGERGEPRNDDGGEEEGARKRVRKRVTEEDRLVGCDGERGCYENVRG